MAYDPELAAKFCAAMASTTDSIATICKRKGMPSKATVFRWKAEQPEFAKMYEAAKDEQIDSGFDEIIEIADKCGASKAAVQKAKLRIYARVEVAQKLKPKKYGNKITQEHTGAGGGPITSKVTVEYVGVGDEDPDSAGV